MYLDPGLAGHLPLLNLVVGDWASSVVVGGFPHEVDVAPGHLSYLQVLGGTGGGWGNNIELSFH